MYSHRDTRKPEYLPVTESKRFLFRREVSPRKIKIKIKLGWAYPGIKSGGGGGRIPRLMERKYPSRTCG